MHYAMLEIEGQFFTTSFDVLEGQDIDILIGLDFLKRHRASIDLSQNALVIPENNIRTRFLNENELPSKNENDSNINDNSSGVMQDDAFDENVKKLVEITGQDRDVCKSTLTQCAGSFDLALNNLTGGQ